MHHRLRLLLPALFSIATAGSIGCDGASVDPPDEANSAQPVAFPILPEAQPMRYYSGMTTKQRLVIRDRAAWADVWKQITSPVQPVLPVPEVDFAKNVIIVVAMGTKGTGGYSIIVDEVRIVAGGTRVSVTEVSPSSGCNVTQAETAPVAVVVVPRFAGEAIFAEHTSQHACQ